MAEIRVIVRHGPGYTLKGQIKAELVPERILDDGQGCPVRFGKEEVHDNRTGAGRGQGVDHCCQAIPGPGPLSDRGQAGFIYIDQDYSGIVMRVPIHPRQGVEQSSVQALQPW